jgi:hypothetical protein
MPYSPEANALGLVGPLPLWIRTEGKSAREDPWMLGHSLKEKLFRGAGRVEQNS